VVRERTSACKHLGGHRSKRVCTSAERNGRRQDKPRRGERQTREIKKASVPPGQLGGVPSRRPDKIRHGIKGLGGGVTRHPTKEGDGKNQLLMQASN